MQVDDSIQVDELLKLMIDKGTSDLHLKVASLPVFQGLNRNNEGKEQQNN